MAQQTDPWNAYAPFYDWENARTLGRADLPFWRRVAREARGRILELGCGTGRLTLPLAKSGLDLVGIDLAEAMLARAERRVRARRRRGGGRSPQLVRGDMRTLPFRRNSLSMVLAPYGVLQSLLSDRDLAATLASVSRVLKTEGLFGIELVPDVPRWREYRNRVQMMGRAPGNTHLTLIESVRQDRARRQTVFAQRYVVRRGRRRSDHVFELRFRTLPVTQMLGRLARNGFAIEASYGDYKRGAWHEGAEQWIILARKRPT
jgi:ubiquinone/menaquinone biosynthesis C-methylase UbiE